MIVRSASLNIVIRPRSRLADNPFPVVVESDVIIVTSLHRDYLPSSWSMHYPSHIDIGVYIGTIGLFFVFFLLFARYFPVLPIAEIKSILKSSGESYKNGTNTKSKPKLKKANTK